MLMVLRICGILLVIVFTICLVDVCIVFTIAVARAVEERIRIRKVRKKNEQKRIYR